MSTILYHTLLICYAIFLSVKNPGLKKVEMGSRHPLHLSSTELNYNSESKTIELSCRIFTDDFEDILAKNYKIKADLSAAAKHKEMDQLINRYMAAHLKLNANGKALPLTYLGFENEKEAVVVYLESAKVNELKKMETTHTVLYDLFDDQINIIHITVNGKRKSAKLNYPNRSLITVF